jgi:uncharacterized glyoxalase superfamily protein PhnB
MGLYPIKLLAEDAGVAYNLSDFSGVTLAQNVGSTQEVDNILNIAKKAGAIITKPGEEKPWGGYTG